MKHAITWFERPQGSIAEYENAQERSRREPFDDWPASERERVGGTA